MIRPHLRPYIHNIQTLPGTTIAIDFYFPQKNRIRLISTYLLSNHTQLRLNTQQQIIDWIKQVQAKQIHPIITGDFNHDLSHDSPSNLSKYLTNNNFIPTINHLLPYTSTWQRVNSSSQIDEIWISRQLIHIFSTPILYDPELITYSDH